MPLIKCLGELKITHDKTAIVNKIKSYTGNGMSEIEADIKVKNEFINEEYETLHKELEKIKQSVLGSKFKPSAFKAVVLPDFKKLNKQYQDEKANEEKPESDATVSVGVDKNAKYLSELDKRINEANAKLKTRRR